MFRVVCADVVGLLLFTACEKLEQRNFTYLTLVFYLNFARNSNINNKQVG